MSLIPLCPCLIISLHEKNKWDKPFMVLVLIGIRHDLSSMRNYILTNPAIPSFDDVSIQLLHISLMQLILMILILLGQPCILDISKDSIILEMEKEMAPSCITLTITKVAILQTVNWHYMVNNHTTCCLLKIAHL